MDIEYYPDKDNKQNPYNKILDFGIPSSTQVLKKLEICKIKEQTNEWPGIVKPLKNKGSNYRWKQWSWRGFRIHFYIDNERNKIIILNAFKKKKDETPRTHIKKSEENYQDYINTIKGS